MFVLRQIFKFQICGTRPPAGLKCFKKNNIKMRHVCASQSVVRSNLRILNFHSNKIYLVTLFRLKPRSGHAVHNPVHSVRNHSTSQNVDNLHVELLRVSDLK